MKYVVLFLIGVALIALHRKGGTKIATYLGDQAKSLKALPTTPRQQGSYLVLAVVVIGLIGLIVTLDSFRYSGSGVSSKAPTPIYRADLRPSCLEKVREDTLTQEFKDLTQGGNCPYVLLEQVVRGECVVVRDRWRKDLGEDCGKGYLDLEGKDGTYFAAVGQPEVRVKYITCRDRMPRRIVEGACSSST